MFYQLTDEIFYPFQRLILILPIEIEFLVFAFSHNVKIGKNCMIAGQVGFAGSVTLGDNVLIGGQSGVSGHLKIGNNVKIGGGSGVIQNIADNSQVMGYPAIPLKEFVKQRKNK